jgi:hypothetical protein
LNAVLRIDEISFRRGHEAFLRKMRDQAKGVPFEDFGHRFFVESETLHKQQVRQNAAAVLEPHLWEDLQAVPGAIVRRLLSAAKKEVCWKLLDLQHGEQHSSAAALYRLLPEHYDEFERQCRKLADSAAVSDAAVGTCVDEMADYLRANRLGCKWEFMAYLLFVLRPERYFPIRSSYFESLLRFYGIEATIQGRVEWSRYQLILDVAELLKEKLWELGYGTANAIQIQSYMWVVAYLLKDDEIPLTAPPPLKADDVLKKRIERAIKQERIGFEGELAVIEFEKRRLCDAGMSHLAELVSLIAAEDPSAGYDVASYRTDGRSLKIEVKSTMRSRQDWDPYWMSENERALAASDPNWTLYRVWEALAPAPTIENLGNVVTDLSDDWRIDPASWCVQRRVAD